MMWVRLRSWAAWIADQEIWLLIAGVSLVMFTSRWATWGLGTLAVTWLVRWRGRGSPTVRTTLDWPAILLLVTIPITLAVTRDRPTTFTAVSRLLAGLALCYGLANWARAGAHFPVLGLGLAAAGVGLALSATVSVVWPVGSKVPITPRAFYSKMSLLVSDTINADMMAGALMMILPFVVSLTFFGDKLSSASGAVPVSAARLLDSRWVRRLWFGASALFVGALLVLTKSRGGWIAGGGRCLSSWPAVGSACCGSSQPLCWSLACCGGAARHLASWMRFSLPGQARLVIPAAFPLAGQADRRSGAGRSI